MWRGSVLATEETVAIMAVVAITVVILNIMRGIVHVSKDLIAIMAVEEVAAVSSVVVTGT